MTPERRSVRLELEAAEHRRLRMLSAATGVPVAKLLRGMVRAALSEEQNGLRKPEKE